ncbi:MAG: hypothetical protein HYZ69_01740 [Candidatus Colwellbacteria bacterium]|nr:hypothetical protein [Candidatus Colwellbacteria bacterium]
MVRTHFVRWFCEKCDSFINFGLANPLRYKEEISLLRKNSLALSRLTGIFYTINPAYRIWNVSYAGIEIPLCELEFAMNKFYMGIAALIDHHQRNFPQSEILAFADHMMDGVIHPWADGCGRNATALVMWLSLLPGFQLPIFGTREEHYASILNLNLHTEYFRQCLDKQS